MTGTDVADTPAPLPRVLVLTDRSVAGRCGRTLAETIELVSGIEGVGVLFREKDLDAVERLALGREVARVAGEAPLLVAGDHLLAAQLGAAGVHLAAGQPTPAVPPGMLTGRSCHTADEVGRAGGAHYVTLSPVAPSCSKPGYGPAIDETELADACNRGVPVYALGGVTPDNAATWDRVGVAGVAVCGAVVGAEDPTTVAEQLRAAVS